MAVIAGVIVVATFMAQDVYDLFLKSPPSDPNSGPNPPLLRGEKCLQRGFVPGIVRDDAAPMRARGLARSYFTSAQVRPILAAATPLTGAPGNVSAKASVIVCSRS